MNAEQLRETTMDPEIAHARAGHASRTPLEADAIFSMLMGDQVEPRRAFIEDNALAATVDI